MESTARDAGTARLWVVVPAAIAAFFYTSILEYSLPLFFGALSEAAEAKGGSYPADIWSKLVLYQVVPWIVGPAISGVLARRYGERLVWAGALFGKALVPFMLAVNPAPWVIYLLALWQGFTGALMWIAGISLVQMVVPEKKGLSNGSMMASLGIGSFLGPICGRALLHRTELWSLVDAGQWSVVWAKLWTFQPMTKPHVSDFALIFWILTFTVLLSGVAILVAGQRPGKFDKQESHNWQQTMTDLKSLMGNSRFWALVISLCLLGGPVFQASNQFLPYRAEALGLKDGSQDLGWIWLQLLKTLMWIPGGAAVGLLAGRKAPGIAAVIMLGAFSLSAAAIGGCSAGWALFVYVAIFEFTRQFMRWSHAGYMSEHLSDHLRATGIGVAISLSGLGSTLWGWAADAFWTDKNDLVFTIEQSPMPFYSAAALGILGAVGLLIFDRFVPIRRSSNNDAAS